MGELKPGWRRVRFGEVVRQVKDRVDPETSGLERYIAGEHMQTDDLRIRSWGEIGEGYLGPAFHMRFRPGQVLYGSRRTYLRKVAVPDFEGICANTTYVLESADPNVLMPELLPFIMSSEPFHEHSVRESKGSVNPYVNFSDLAWYEFALPPLEEQGRAVEVLVAARATLEHHFAAIAASERLYASTSSALFAPALATDSASQPTPRQRWSTRRLGSVTPSNAPICYGIVQVGDDTPNGVPTLAIKNITGDAKIHRTAEYIETSYQRSRVAHGDLVIAIKATIGPIAEVPPNFDGNISRDLARVRLDKKMMSAAFFYHLWRSPDFERYYRSLTVGSTRAEGVGQPSVHAAGRVESPARATQARKLAFAGHWQMASQPRGNTAMDQTMIEAGRSFRSQS